VTRWRTVEVDVTRADIEAAGYRTAYGASLLAVAAELAAAVGAPPEARGLVLRTRYEAHRAVYSLAWEEPR
jgi:hypothetical protein